MAQRLRALLGVVDRLVDLASIWDCSALQATDRIELWPLLQHAWAGVEPLALQRAVRVRFRAQTEAGALAILYGSEHWLGRVFEECLRPPCAAHAAAPRWTSNTARWGPAPW